MTMVHDDGQGKYTREEDQDADEHDGVDRYDDNYRNHKEHCIIIELYTPNPTPEPETLNPKPYKPSTEP